MSSSAGAGEPADQSEESLFVDCLGMSQDPYGGIAGRHVTSDVQFAQLMQHEMRYYNTSPDIIDEYLHLDLQLRFIVDEYHGLVAASEVLLTWSNSFQKVKEADREPRDTDVNLDLEPQVHGFDFQAGMYGVAESISLKDKVVSTWLFDKMGSLAGVRIYDVKTKSFETLSSLPQDRLADELPDDKRMMENLGKTRLVGLRTAKICDSETKIMQVTPIYYSID